MATIAEQLGAIYGPTKVNHGYMRWYGRHFDPIRHQVQRVLEIGVQTDRSIKMWEEYFPNAEIIGLDIDPACKAYSGGRRTVVIGDQSDESFMDSLGRTFGPFDVVIDDGSHIPDHILLGFQKLFPYLTENALYVMEDIGGVTGDFTGSVHTFLKQLVDGINFWPQGAPCAFWPYVGTLEGECPILFERIIGVSFYRWMCFIECGKNPQVNQKIKQPEELTEEVLESALKSLALSEADKQVMRRTVLEDGYFARHKKKI